MFVTFLYKLPGESKTYYGKYVTTYLSDDHEGLDQEVKSILVGAINQWQEKQGFPRILQETEVILGILSFSFEHRIPVYSTDAEIAAFDFYYRENGWSSRQTYVHGVLV